LNVADETAGHTLASEPVLRPLEPSEAVVAQAVWEASTAVDEPGSPARGGWSLEAWATAQCALVVEGRVVGVAAIRAEPGSTNAASGRVALDPRHRAAPLARMLVDATVGLARGTGAEVLRLFAAAAGDWLLDVALDAGFVPVRSVFHMLLPASAPLPQVVSIDGIRIRAIHADEDSAVLDTLNRNWEGTWAFVPIRAEMLESDLAGQREGMLLAVDDADDARILATCHAVFDPADQNPDGDPRAWISNLTVDASQRGRGLGRSMLVAGLRSLRARGAGSIMLGVDAGDPAPLRLYQSVGFQTISVTRAWDKQLRA
jgi:mycothiol synthase